MRRFTNLAAVVMVATFIRIDGISIMPIAASASARELRRDMQDRVADVIAATRKALGGEDKIASIKALSAEGDPKLSNLLGVMKALGLRLHADPAAQA